LLFCRNSKNIANYFVVKNIKNVPFL